MKIKTYLRKSAKAHPAFDKTDCGEFDNSRCGFALYVTMKAIRHRNYRAKSNVSLTSFEIVGEIGMPIGSNVRNGWSTAGRALLFLSDLRFAAHITRSTLL